MKGMKIGLVFLVLVVSVFCVGAVSNKKDCQGAVEGFLKGILAGEIDKSYDELLTGSALADKKEAIDNLKNQTKTMAQVYGPLQGFEFIKEQEYGKSIVRLVYILKGKQIPIVCELYFYKSDSEWKLININISDNLENLASK